MRHSFYFWAIVLPLSVVNLSLFGIIRASEFGSLSTFIIGLMLGELNWIAIWAVLAPAAWHLRLRDIVAATILLLGSSAYAFVLNPPPEGRTHLAEFAFFLPVLLTAIQLPLWLMRLTLGWQVRSTVCAVNGASATDARRFRLPHLFGAISAIAVSLAAARGTGASPFDVVGVFGICAAVSIAIVPWIISGIIIRSMVIATVVAAGYAAAISAAAACAITADGVGFRKVFWDVLGLAVGTALVVHGGLRFMHAAGYAMPLRFKRKVRNTVAGSNDQR